MVEVKVMKWRLALDMGTNSLGWAVFGLTDDNKVNDLIDLGVRIFPNGREPKSGLPLNVQRRNARLTRRQRARRKKRYNEVANILARNNLIPQKGEDRAKFHDINPYEARNACVTEQNVDKYYLGRALLNLAFHRGFLSNRKEEKNQESAPRLKQIAALREKLAGKTLGQYLYEKYEVEVQKRNPHKSPLNQMQGIRFRGEAKEQDGIFPDRQMIIDEFQKIKECQQNTISNEEWLQLEDAIFFQRPLEEQKRGLCSILWQDKEVRALKCQPTAERFRIWQKVNDLKWRNEDGELITLNNEQKLAVANKLLETKKDVKFVTILKLKDDNKQPLFADALGFNLQSDVADSLKGAPVLATLQKLPLYEKFVKLAEEEQDDIIELLHDEANFAILNNKLKTYGFNDAEISELNLINLPTGTTNISAKIMRFTLPHMQNGYQYHEAINLAGNDLGINLHHSMLDTGEIFDKLPYYGEILRASVIGGDFDFDKETHPEKHFGKIANPTVHVALNQLQKLVNHLIAKFGCPPEQVFVETSRELNMNEKKKKEHNAKQKKNEENNKRYQKDAEEAGYHKELSAYDLKKFRLWEELGKDKLPRTCVFTGRNITISNLLNREVHIEHLLPYAETLDNSMNNLTICFEYANKFKGKKTPYEAFAHSPDGYNWYEIMDRVERSIPHKKWRFAHNAMEQFTEHHADFLTSQLTDNQYISRLAKDYVGKVVHPNNCITVKGGITSRLRGQWKLNKLIGATDNKERDDHRHHAIDAFTIGLAERSLMQKIATMAKKDAYGELHSKLPPLNEKLTASLVNKLDYMAISYKPDHSLNALFFKETAYGFINDEQLDADFKGYNLVTTKPIQKPTKPLKPKQIERIRDIKIRHELLEFMQNPAYKNLKYDKKLAEFSKQTGIKSVRILEPNASVTRLRSAPYKGYAKDSYAFVDIWQIPKKKAGKYHKGNFEYKGVFVSFADAILNDNKNTYKPHPAAKHCMRLFKDDCIIIDGEIFKVFGFSTTDNRIDISNQYTTDNKRKQNYKSIDKLMRKNMEKCFIDIDGNIMVNKHKMAHESFTKNKLNEPIIFNFDDNKQAAEVTLETTVEHTNTIN